MAKTDTTTAAPALPRTYNLLDALRELKAETLQVERTVGEGLILRAPEIGEVRGASVKPCFPVMEPDRFLFFTGAKGEELGVLESTRGLSAASCQALREELEKQQFMPVIMKVNAVFSDFQVPIWEVLTDHGPRRLELRSAHDVHTLEGGRVYVRDAEGNGYIIPNLSDLDPVSLSLIEIYV